MIFEFIGMIFDFIGHVMHFIGTLFEFIAHLFDFIANQPYIAVRPANFRPEFLDTNENIHTFLITAGNPHDLTFTPRDEISLYAQKKYIPAQGSRSRGWMARFYNFLGNKKHS